MVILLVVIVGLLARINQFPGLMPFLQDQGWYYISARDILLTQQLPLVGITSSHTWLHQGAIWTYFLALLIKIFGPNPLTGGLFAVGLGTVSIFLFYLLLREMFSRRVGIIGAVLFATSPLVIFHSRMSYHTMPIPFFMILLIYSVTRWVKGDRRFFPLIFLLTGILYNLELATSVVIPVLMIVFLFGLLKKKSYVEKILNLKSIALSSLLLLLPMLPMLLYDFRNGFPQTIKFGIWVIYKFAVFFGYPSLHLNAPGETWATFFSHFSIIIQRMIFSKSFYVSLALLLMAFAYLLYVIYKQHQDKKVKGEYLIIFLYLSFSVLGYIVTKTNSEAYLLIAFPAVFGAIAIFFDFLMDRKGLLIPTVVLIVLIASLNIHELRRTSYFSYSYGYGVPYKDKLDISKKIIKEAEGKPYNIVGRGWGSQYESFTKTYEYLTWWLGEAPSKNPQKLKFYITELPDKIVLETK